MGGSLSTDETLHCIAVNSATAGLHLALEAIGIGPGDEVITTTHTFTATAEVVRYLGADVKLVDIDPATLNIAPALIEAAITPRTKAIMPVHYAGLAKRIQVMRLHGMSRDAFDRFTAKVPSWYYEIVAPGFKYNLTDIASAMGIHQLKRAHAFHARRSQIALAYNAAFADLPLITPPLPKAGDLHAWHLYALRLGPAAPIDRNTLIERLFADGIGCSVHYIPLHLQPYWRDRYALRPEQFPHSQHAYEQMLSLPIHTRMSEADVQRVVAAVRHALA